ncbi:MAG: hypothetical protein LBH81_00385 [Rickettsiales bacterium]|nr:hypothetical protein [Rickettsiales bacterium]
MPNAYSALGVSSSKTEVHAATKNNDKGLFPFAFCKINPCKTFGPKYVKISHADGAGTKSSLAYMYWKETGDMSVWHGIVQDSIVMNLDDILCVGGAAGELDLTSNIDRNTFRIPGEVVAELIKGENIFLNKMRGYGIDITGQCGETADVPDLTQTLLVNNTMHCIMRRSAVIDNGNIREGDKIVGLASFGQAEYETEYNGGMRSNGLTLARHGTLDKIYRKLYPETFEKKLGRKAYRGSAWLSDLVKVETGEKIPVGKLILSPTRTYAPIIAKLHQTPGCVPVGMVHNSGGGMTKVLNYLSKPLKIVKDNLFDTPALFKMIQSNANVDWQEMYQDFNMGCGMEIYVRSTRTAEKIIEISKSFGVDAKIIGHVSKARVPKPQVELITKHAGIFRYSR